MSVSVRVLAFAVTVAAAAAVAGAGGTKAVFTVSPDKDPKCHNPVISNCNSSLYPIMDYTVAGWFFHAPFKSCRPLYTDGGVHSCAKNMDLPLTKSECEEICGEPCLMGNGSQGICMLEEYCKPTSDKTSAHPRPCGAYNVKCCPKNWNPQAAVVAAKYGTASRRDEPEPIVHFIANKRHDCRRQHPRYEYGTTEPSN